MIEPLMKRPSADEYSDYYQRYLDLVPDQNVLDLLEHQIEDTLRLVKALPEERALERYAPGKWSVKEVLGHLADSERVFAYRALRFARADQTPLPGFEEQDYVRAARFDQQPLTGLIEELRSVRRASLLLFRSLDAGELGRRGTANGREISVRALVWIIAAHERHHARILRERYGLS